MEPLEKAVVIPPDVDAIVAQASKALGRTITREEAQAVINYEGSKACWKNDVYTVLVDELPDGGWHLSVRRNDRSPPRDWRELQEIKNQICGKEAEGVELFPAESRVVDVANQTHLWVLPFGERFRVGYNEGNILNEVSSTDPNAPFVQRARSKKEGP